MDKIRRIALVGNGATTRASDNFDGEIWTTASVAKILPRVDRVFEVHKEYDAVRLNGYKCPIMTDGVKVDLPASVDLEIDNLVNIFGPIFQFSFDYMMAHVLDCHMRDIEIGVDEHIEITTYGIDLTTDTEYNKFRQSFLYWIGYLRGAGITVNISPGSAILNRKWVYCHNRDEIDERIGGLEKIGLSRREEFEKKEDEARLNLAFSNGFLQAIEELRK